jgi:hypothetical protein
MTVPPSCSIESPIETVPIRAEILNIGGVLYERIIPKEGVVFGSFKLTGCSLGGTYNTKGEIRLSIGERGNLLLEQPAETSPLISFQGSSLGWFFGTNLIEAAMKTYAYLTGAHEGDRFGVV